jgi:NADH-quinone oxidoreductase subunit J
MGTPLGENAAKHEELGTEHWIAMTLADAFFYLFAGLTVVAAMMVILARNPVHAVLWLILAFFNAAGLFLLLGAEFLAMILVVVYVGAVAVLFLFVVMMLDVDFAALRAGFIRNAPLGFIIGAVVLAELVTVLFFRLAGALPPPGARAGAAPVVAGITNTEAIGRILYKELYVYYFQSAGLILLVAMIGAIVLTLRHKEGVKRQDIGRQNARGPATAIDIVKVPSGGYTVPETPAKAKEPA